MRLRLSLSLAAAVLAAPLSLAFSFNQPPTNLGMTTFLDGGGAPPGVYLVEYVQHTLGAKALDKNGNEIPGNARVGVLANLNQVWWLTPWKVAGAYFGLDLGLPVVGVTAKGSLGATALTANTAGVGDFFIGPALQWNDHKLLGRPFYHRVEVTTVLPTGSYDGTKGANPGANVLTIESYYAFSWHFAKEWETSWRLVYGVHGENDATRVRPGRVLHANYALSRAVNPKLRLGASGYWLQQITDDKSSGVSSPGTRERVFSLGPALSYNASGTLIMLSHPMEFGVRNRLRGHRTTLEVILRL